MPLRRRGAARERSGAERSPAGLGAAAVAMLRRSKAEVERCVASVQASAASRREVSEASPLPLAGGGGGGGGPGGVPVGSRVGWGARGVAGVVRGGLGLQHRTSVFKLSQTDDIRNKLLY